MATGGLEHLTRRLREGDRDAFDELVRACHGSVFALANRMLRNVDDAQDVAQEAFLAAYQGLAGFRGGSSVRTWLLAITYRKAVDRLKRRRVEGWPLSGRLEDAPFWDSQAVVENLTDWGQNPEQHFLSNQWAAALKAALEKVPAESRAVFELRDLQGFSSREAAEVLGVSEGAVRVRLHRVRQFLMLELNGLFAASTGPG